MPSWLTAVLAVLGPVGGLLSMFPPQTIAHKIGLALVGLTAGGAAASPGFQKPQQPAP